MFLTKTFSADSFGCSPPLHRLSAKSKVFPSFHCEITALCHSDRFNSQTKDGRRTKLYETVQRHYRKLSTKFRDFSPTRFCVTAVRARLTTLTAIKLERYILRRRNLHTLCKTTRRWRTPSFKKIEPRVCERTDFLRHRKRTEQSRAAKTKTSSAPK